MAKKKVEVEEVEEEEIEEVLEEIVEEKPKKKKTAAKRKPPVKRVIVKGQVNKVAKSHKPPLKVALPFYDAVDKAVKALVLKACDRAHENHRKTVFAQDV